MIKRIDVIGKKRKWIITTDFYGRIDNHEIGMTLAVDINTKMPARYLKLKTERMRGSNGEDR